MTTIAWGATITFTVNFTYITDSASSESAANVSITIDIAIVTNSTVTVADAIVVEIVSSIVVPFAVVAYAADDADVTASAAVTNGDMVSNFAITSVVPLIVIVVFDTVTVIVVDVIIVDPVIVVLISTVIATVSTRDNIFYRATHLKHKHFHAKD